MKKKRMLILCFLLVSCSLLTVAQKNYIGAYSVPPSAEAAAMARSVNTPVDKYTGVLGIQIPLYTASTGAFNLPVSLAYQAGGIRVGDMATCVGLGWRLAAGGKITRIVKHYPDEQGFSALTNNQGSVANNLASWTSGNFESRLKDLDTEPDLFYYEIPGRSGMFVINHDQKVCMLPYQPVKVEWINKNYFVLTDENGIKYVFGENNRDLTQSTVNEENSSKTISFTSTWHLERICFLNNDVITFEYESGSDYGFSVNNTRFMVNYHHVVDDDPKKHFLTEIAGTFNLDTRVQIKSPKYLERITWKGGELVFKNSGGRLDTPEMFKLDEIEIYDYSKKYLKSICFDYSHFLNKALKLDAIYESASGKRLAIHQFEYYTDKHLPDKNSLDFDHWGFYNGAQNIRKYPAISILSGELKGDDHSPVLEYARANTIKRIYYATGGYKEFDYELNTTAGGGKVGGLRIRQIKEKKASDEDVLVTSYVYSDLHDRQGGECFNNQPEYKYLLSYAPREKKIRGTKVWYKMYIVAVTARPLLSLSDINGTIVGYPKVKEIAPNGGYTIDYFDAYSVAPDELHRTYDVIGKKYLSFQNLHTTNTSKFWERGRLRKRINYDAGGNEVSRQVIGYKPQSGAKQEVNGFIPYYSGEGMVMGNGVDLRIPLIGVYKWISQPVLTDTVVITGKDKPAVSTIYKYHPDYLLPVEIETKSAVDRLTYKTIIKYPFHFTGIQAYNVPQAQAIKSMNQNHVLNIPIETIHYRNGKVVGGKIQEYKHIFISPNLSYVVPAQTRILKITAPLDSYSGFTITGQGEVYVDPHYEITDVMDNYDRNGNLLQLRTLNGNPRSVIYGYNNTATVAMVENASVNVTDKRQNEVFYTSFEDNREAVNLPTAKSGTKAFKGVFRMALDNFKPGPYRLSYWKSVNGRDWNKVSLFFTVAPPTTYYNVGEALFYIDELRLLPEDAGMTTSTYLPGVGKSSETDRNGQTTYYEYDVFGRLVRVMDNERRLLKEYEYTILNN